MQQNAECRCARPLIVSYCIVKYCVVRASFLLSHVGIANPLMNISLGAAGARARALGAYRLREGIAHFGFWLELWQVAASSASFTESARSLGIGGARFFQRNLTQHNATQPNGFCYALLWRRIPQFCERIRKVREQRSFYCA